MLRSPVGQPLPAREAPIGTGMRVQPTMADPMADVLEFAQDVRYSDIPGDVIDRVKALLLESVGSTILAATTPYGQSLARGLGFASQPVYARLGGEISNLEAACFYNAAAADCTDSVGGSYPAVVHPGKNVLPSAVTWANTRPYSGPDLLRAIVVACEFYFRLDYIMALDHQARGHYSDGTLGALGAAFALGSLEQLPRDDLARVLGSAGVMGPLTIGGSELFRSEARPLAMGSAAQAAVRAIQMHVEGIRGPIRLVEAPGGFVRALSNASDLSRLSEGLGTVWELRQTYIKRSVGCNITNPARKALLRLVSSGEISAADVSRIDAYHPAHDVRVVGHHPTWDGGIVEHACSAPYLMAGAMLYNELGPEVLSEHRRRDPKLSELAGRIHISEDPEMTEQYASGLETRATSGRPVRLEVKLRSGKILSEDLQRGSVDDVIPGNEAFNVGSLKSQFVHYVSDVIAEDDANTFVERVGRLEEFEDARECFSSVPSILDKR